MSTVSNPLRFGRGRGGAVICAICDSICGNQREKLTASSEAGIKIRFLPPLNPINSINSINYINFLILSLILRKLPHALSQ